MFYSEGGGDRRPGQRGPPGLWLKVTDTHILGVEIHNPVAFI